MKKTITVSRRQVLRGAGGFTLGLPFLGSILTPRGSLAQVVPAMKRRFAFAFIGHGNIKPENFFPTTPTPKSETLFPGHVIRAGQLAPSRENGRVVFSQALQAPADLLSEALVGKMNILRAIDYPYFCDHTDAAPLGNFAFSGAGSDFKGQDPRETIDHVLGWSKTFYDRLDGIRERTLYLSTRQWGSDASWRYASPATKSGPLVRVAQDTSPAKVWDKLFLGTGAATASPTQPAAPPPRPIMDLVIEDYRRLRKSNSRLGAEDARRLDEHVDRLTELERKIKVVEAGAGGGGASCGKGPERPTLVCAGKGSSCAGDPKLYMDVFTDLIAAGFMCGVNRVAVLEQAQSFVSSFSGDWHQQVAHTGNQALLSENCRNTFAHAVVSLAKKLDVEEGGGRTYLDNTLLMFGNENGYNTHWGVGVPIVTFGSAGGFFRTGQMVDFRPNDEARGYGITYNQWLAIVLQSMGLPRAEFEVGGQQGYGRMKIGSRFQGKYVPDAITGASRVPDLLRAT